MEATLGCTSGSRFLPNLFEDKPFNINELLVPAQKTVNICKTAIRTKGIEVQGLVNRISENLNILVKNLSAITSEFFTGIVDTISNCFKTPPETQWEVELMQIDPEKVADELLYDDEEELPPSIASEKAPEIPHKTEVEEKRMSSIEFEDYFFNEFEFEPDLSEDEDVVDDDDFAIG